MSKGGESQRENRLGTGRSGLGRKGWGGSRKALKEHPLPCLSIKELRNPLPAGREGRRASPTSPDALPQPRGSPSQAPRAMPPRDWLCSPDRWWGAQLVRYQPPPGASLSHSAAASLRLGPRRVIKHRPGPDPASFPSFLWPDWQVGTSDKDWGLRQFWGRQLHAPCPLSGQEHEVGGKVNASPAPQGPQDGVPTILVQLVGKGLRRLLERPGGVGWGEGNLTPLLTQRATPAQPTTPPHPHLQHRDRTAAATAPAGEV